MLRPNRVCPHMKVLWEMRVANPQSYSGRDQYTTLCAWCDRGKDELFGIPSECPETCIVWDRTSTSMTGGCELDCPCKEPADEEWLANMATRKTELATQDRASNNRRKRQLYEETVYSPGDPKSV